MPWKLRKTENAVSDLTVPLSCKVKNEKIKPVISIKNEEEHVFD